MKKTLLATTLLTLSFSIYADGGGRIFNEKNYTTGDASIGNLVQLEREFGSINDKNSQTAQGKAIAHNAQGKKNTVIPMHGNHEMFAVNRWNNKCRGHVKYELRCDNASFIHEFDYELNPQGTIHDKATTNTVAQKQKTGSWLISVWTFVYGEGDCGSVTDIDRAHLKVN